MRKQIKFADAGVLVFLLLLRLFKISFKLNFGPFLLTNEENCVVKGKEDKIIIGFGFSCYIHDHFWHF